MIDLRIVTPPTEEPISVAEVKANARIDYADEDALIEHFIMTAREHVEGYTGLALTDAVYEYRTSEFSDPIYLPVAPVREVVSVSYMDGDGVLQAVDPIVYWLDDHPTYPRIFINAGEAWPAVGDRANAVRVRVRGGPEPVPAQLKQAMLLLVGHW